MYNWIRTITLAVFSVVFFSGCAVVPQKPQPPEPGKVVLFGGATFATDVFKHPCLVDERRDSNRKVVYYFEKCTEEYTLGPYRCIRSTTKMSRNGVVVPQRPQEPRCRPLGTQPPVKVAPWVPYPPQVLPRVPTAPMAAPQGMTVVPSKMVHDTSSRLQWSRQSQRERPVWTRPQAPLKPVRGAKCVWLKFVDEGEFPRRCELQVRSEWNMNCTITWTEVLSSSNELLFSNYATTEKYCKPQPDDGVSPNRRRH